MYKWELHVEIIFWEFQFEYYIRSEKPCDYAVCIYSKLLFRYEYFNKGADLYIEALARLNHLLKVFFALILLHDIDNNNNVDDDILMFLEEIKIVLTVYL